MELGSILLGLRNPRYRHCILELLIRGEGKDARPYDLCSSVPGKVDFSAAGIFRLFLGCVGQVDLLD